MRYFVYVLIFILVSATGCEYKVYHSINNKETQAVAEEYVHMMTAGCYPDEINAVLTEELDDAVGLEELVEICEKCEQMLGEFESFEDFESKETTGHADGEDYKMAEYIIAADYEAGRANIRVRLLEQDNEWKLLGFNLKSEAFLYAEE